MKNLFILIALLSCMVYAAINYDTLSENGWMQVHATNEFPRTGGDILSAIDTAGNFYMFGGCTYGNGAGGTHNSDIFRVDLNTGEGVLLANCANNVWGWKGGCQYGHAYDINRNRVWIASQGRNTGCTGGDGLWKFQCPSGPFLRVNGCRGNKYLVYDFHNDLLYQTGNYDLHIYNPKTNQWLADSPYPFYTGGNVNTFAVPCCYDTLRRLFVMTLVNPAYGRERTDMYFYNGATGEWHTKSPPQKPGFTQGAMEYDPVNDAYVYMAGDCVTEVWLYRYEANTWTQMDPGNRAYNDASPQTSTWPPTRKYGQFNTYSPRHNAFFTWGGGTWSDSHCSDMDNGIQQPFWIYRPPQTGPSVVRNVRLADDPGALNLEVWPNPFNSNVKIMVRRYAYGVQRVSSQIYDISGKLVKDFTPYASRITPYAFTWNPSNCPAGTYIIKANIGNKTLSKKVLLQK